MMALLIIREVVSAWTLDELVLVCKPSDGWDDSPGACSDQRVPALDQPVATCVSRLRVIRSRKPHLSRGDSRVNILSYCAHEEMCTGLGLPDAVLFMPNRL